jgi:hypothetical protein
MTPIALARTGHVACIIGSTAVIWWNVATSGNVWLTLANAGLVAINLAMLWTGRNV